VGLYPLLVQSSKSFQKPPFLVQSDFLFPLPLSMGGIELRLSPSPSGEWGPGPYRSEVTAPSQQLLDTPGGDFLIL